VVMLLRAQADADHGLHGSSPSVRVEARFCRAAPDADLIADSAVVDSRHTASRAQRIAARAVAQVTLNSRERPQRKHKC
ncbi:MAG: hypothetical protein ACRC2B_11310, partial [Rubrivivax sp.]